MEQLRLTNFLETLAAGRAVNKRGGPSLRYRTFHKMRAANEERKRAKEEL